MNNRIRSLWDLHPNKLKERHIRLIMESETANQIIDFVAIEFIKSHSEYFTLGEFKNVARESIWRAIRNFDPDKGKLTTFIHYHCKAYLSAYVNKHYQSRYKKEIELNEEIYDEKLNLEDKILAKVSLEKILSQIHEDNKKLLKGHYLEHTKIKESMKYFNISRFKLQKMLNIAIIEARSVCG